MSLLFCVLQYSLTHITNFTQEIISIEGVRERVRFQNPHTSVLIKSIDATGKETFWLVETTGKTTLGRGGVSMETLVIGSHVTARGRKGRRDITMYLQEITFEDGCIFTPQPDRN